MKRLILMLMLVIAALFSLTGCSLRRVEAGYVGLKVHKLGGEKGMDVETLPLGRHFFSINEEFHKFPVFLQNVRCTKDRMDFSPKDESINFQSKEGMSINADFGYSYRLADTKVPYLFQKHRKGIEEITNIYVRNIITDAFNAVASTMAPERPKK